MLSSRLIDEYENPLLRVFKGSVISKFWLVSVIPKKSEKELLICGASSHQMQVSSILKQKSFSSTICLKKHE